ncbi:MAG: hypothetical protein V4456_11270 [Bacteroidota bacterium]
MNGQLNISTRFDLPDARALDDFDMEMIRLGGKFYTTFRKGYTFNGDNQCQNPMTCYDFTGKCLFFKFKAAIYEDDKIVCGWEHGLNGSLYGAWFQFADTKYNGERYSVEGSFKTQLDLFINSIKNAPKSNLPSNAATLYNIKNDLRLLEMDYQSLFFQQSLF